MAKIKDLKDRDAKLDVLIAEAEAKEAAKTAELAKQAIRDEYEAARKVIQDKANADLEALQISYGEQLA